MNFRYKVLQFLSGRYGVDVMFYLLFSIAAILAIANWFVRSIILQMVVYAIVVYAFSRAMSRNIQARQRENQALVRAGQLLLKRRKLYNQRRADYNHVYKKCPACHAVLRLPRKKGKHFTVCPKCNKKIRVYVFKA